MERVIKIIELLRDKEAASQQEGVSGVPMKTKITEEFFAQFKEVTPVNTYFGYDSEGRNLVEIHTFAEILRLDSSKSDEELRIEVEEGIEDIVAMANKASENRKSLCLLRVPFSARVHKESTDNTVGLTIRARLGFR